MVWRIVLSLAAITIGGGLIAVGWLRDPEGYGGAVLLEVGASILLVVLPGAGRRRRIGCSESTSGAPLRFGSAG
jgi:hypothetical protein